MKKVLVTIVSILTTITVSGSIRDTFIYMILPERRNLVAVSVYEQALAQLELAFVLCLCTVLILAVGFYHRKYKIIARWSMMIVAMVIGSMVSLMLKNTQIIKALAAGSGVTDIPVSLTIHSLTLYMVPLYGFALALVVLAVTMYWKKTVGNTP